MKDMDRPDASFTCAASRHVELIADGLAYGGAAMAQLREEPDHCAESMRATVRALWEARRQARAAQETAGALQLVLIEARSIVEDWAAYAPEYFKRKHRLADDLALLDRAIERGMARPEGGT